MTGLRKAASRIRLLLMDVDGVLTDGRLFYVERTDGRVEETKGFNAQDGVSLLWAREAGLETGIISGRSSNGVVHRARMLKMSHIVQGTFEKLKAYERIRAERGYAHAEVAFVGDDLTDLPVLKACGLPVAVANARPEVRAAARVVTRRTGGDGAVREVVELLLKSQGKWKPLLARFGGLS